MLELIKDLFFPKRCLGCGKWEGYLCADCLNFIKVKNEPICPFCGRPSRGGFTHPGCQRPWGFDGLTSVFHYQGVLKKAIIKLKYQFVTDLAETILELFLSFIGEDKSFTKFITRGKVCLVPVPLFWTRENWRGFNQAELLGAMIAEKLDISFIPDLLRQTRFVPPQSELKKAEHQENVAGAFAINRKKTLNTLISQYPHILLFDDLWLTGATLKTCAQVLKRNKIKKVWALTLAR